MQAEAATSSKATRSPQRRNQQQQDLQRNLRHFLSIASAGDLNTIYRNRPVWATNDEKYLTETALQVFKSVPSAKLAVLNYVGLLAHEGTHLHMSKCENSHFSVDASAIEGAVYRFAQVFNQSLNEIDTKEWATDMLRWSSLLLAEVCKQNAGRRATNGPAGPLTLVELLRVYVLCPCIEQVIDLLNASIKFLLNCDPESCISVIVETAKIYGANFDWIITHVGTMFPGAMVNPLLSVGLEEFRTYVTDLSVREAQLPQMTAAQLHEDYQLKFRSLSAILSHLARQQSAELKTSLRRLLVESLTTNGVESADLSLAFLFKLVTFSPNVLRVLVQEANDLVTPANVLLATRRIGSVAKCFVLPDRSYDTFLMQMINAIDQADVCVLLNRLLPIAFDPNIYADIPPSDQPLAAAIQAQTALMLEQVLTDVLRTAHAHIALELDAFPLLKKYCDDTELQNLIGLMLEGSDSGRKFHLRLLAAFSVASGEMKSAEVLARILFATRGEAQLAAFQAFAIAIVPLFPELTNLMVKILPRLRNVLTDSTDDTWLFNLLTLIRWEREQSADDQHGGIIRLSQALLADFGAAVTDFISFATAFDRVSTVKCCLAIIESLETPTHLLPRFAFKIAHQMVDVIFFALAQADSEDGIALLKMAYNCAFIFVESQVYLCRQEFLATLIERAFADCDAIFGTGRPGGDKDSSKSQDSDISLLAQNYKLVSKRNAAAMVHSGVIGRGAKRNEQVVVKEDALLKRLLFVDVVDKFCQQRASGEGEMIMYNLHTSRQLAVLLTDHLCVDSISAYHAWEDWDLERDAVPRYIEVSKRVNDIPFAWDLLFLVAEAYPGLWFCLPVVKAMLASLMSQLESSVEKTKAVDAKILAQLDRWFLLVTKGMMLPVQLSQIYEVASKVSVHEAFILLLDIWRYFQSMSPESHVLAAHFDQLQVKVAHRVDPLMGDVERFTENCRLVIQRNIAAVGYLFPKLFPDLLSQPS